MSELDKIHLLVHPLGPSNVTQDSSMKIIWEKLIFMYLLTQFWHFKIFALVRWGCLEPFFTDPNSQSIQCLLSFLTLNSRSECWSKVVALQLLPFVYIHLEKASFWCFFFCFELSALWYIHQPSWSIADICKSWKWIFPHSITLLFSIFQPLLTFNYQRLLRTKRKNSFYEIVKLLVQFSS